MGSQTVLIAGTKVAGILRTIPGFRIADDVYATLGTHYFGTFDGKPVIRTTVIPDNEMLLVSKGSSMFESSLIQNILGSL
jgi:hypothetical protein